MTLIISPRFSRLISMSIKSRSHDSHQSICKRSTPDSSAGGLKYDLNPSVFSLNSTITMSGIVKKIEVLAVFLVAVFFTNVESSSLVR